jgi:hypothetical protein
LHKPLPQSPFIGFSGSPIEKTDVNALETNKSAAQVLGNMTLKTIAREFVPKVCRSVMIDLTNCSNFRAQVPKPVKYNLP